MANPTTPAAAPQPVKPLRVALFIGVPALLAVVAVVWALRRPQASDLPVYVVETPGLGEPLTLLVGGSAEVLLRPATAVNAPVAAAAFWLRNGQAEQWHAVTAVSAEGTVAFQGPIDSGNRGVEGELAFVVTRAAQAPKPQECQPPACQVLRRPVRFVRPTVPQVPPG